MFDNLNEVEKNFEEANKKLADPDVISKMTEYKKYTKLRSKLEPIINEYRVFKNLKSRIAEAREVLDSNDTEMKELARIELDELTPEIEKSSERLKILMLPKDPNDDKDIIIEVRAGTGGDEAGIFAGDLFRMYCRYAELKGWKVKIITRNESTAGGVKEVIFNISGKQNDQVYSKMKFESGVHRVQRVPVTETQGRIHTSAATVAVLPEADEVDIDIKENDLKIDTYCSSGPGGQSVNTTQSAIRITHLPTNLVVTCQDEKSQHKNKASAMRVLKARLYDLEMSKQQAEIADSRKSMVGSGDRSERIRTYNWPQGRVTDHRIGLTLYKLPYIVDGDLDELIDALSAYDQAEKLKFIGESNS
jgi:peptide chain release factor 1